MARRNRIFAASVSPENGGMSGLDLSVRCGTVSAAWAGRGAGVATMAAVAKAAAVASVAAVAAPRVGWTTTCPARNVRLS